MYQYTIYIREWRHNNFAQDAEYSGAGPAAAIVNDRPVLSLERAPLINKSATV
jgi:hypothetical protein